MMARILLFMTNVHQTCHAQPFLISTHTHHSPLTSEIKADDFSIKGTKLKEKSKDKKSSKDKKKNHDGTEKRPPKPKVDELLVSSFPSCFKKMTCFYFCVILNLDLKPNCVIYEKTPRKQSDE